MRLGELLIQNHLLKESQLKIGLQEHRVSKKPLGQILIEHGFVAEDIVLKYLSEKSGGLFVDLLSFSFDASLLNEFGESFCRKYKVLPIIKGEGNMSVALPFGANINILDAVEEKSGLFVEPYYSSETDLLIAIERCFSNEQNSSARFEQLIEKAVESTRQQKYVTEQGGVIALVDQILNDAITKGASDIHLEPSENVFRLKYRADGVLHLGEGLPKTIQSAVTTRLKIMANLDISITNQPQDGQIRFKYGSKTMQLRFSSFPIAFGEKLVLRVLKLINVHVDHIGFQIDVLSTYKELLQSDHGMIIVTGPTGSGKTTTLYSSLLWHNDGQFNIQTIEDPIEFIIPNLNQCQVNDKAGLTYSNGLRTILRQDPDIIFVGETRDEETAQIAINAAMTGHLVFTSLHTNDAAGAFPRLTNMGVEPFLVASNVIGVIAQRLLRKSCEKCSRPVQKIHEIHKEIAKEMMIDVKYSEFKEGKGCEFCRGKGVKGRIPILELLVVDEEIRKMVVGKKTANDIKNHAFGPGKGISLRRDALMKCCDGLIPASELIESGIWYQK